MTFVIKPPYRCRRLFRRWRHSPPVFVKQALDPPCNTIDHIIRILLSYSSKATLKLTSISMMSLFTWVKMATLNFSSFLASVY